MFGDLTVDLVYQPMFQEGEQPPIRLARVRAEKVIARVARAALDENDASRRKSFANTAMRRAEEAKAQRLRAILAVLVPEAFTG